MKTPYLFLLLAAVSIAPLSSPAQDAPPAAPAATAPADGANAPRAGGRRGGGAQGPAATNHIEVHATGAIWMPSPNPAALGIYPYGADSVVHDGVPQGTFEKFTHTSTNVYPGVMRRVWIYVPAQYDPKVPACLMVVQDGVMQYAGRVADRTMGITPEYRVPTVIDNLTARGELPVIISVFLDSGSTTLGDTGRPAKQNRSIEYDTVSDKYYQFLSQEILPDVEKKYNIRKDPAGRAIIGISSGAICAFNVAWNHPDQFGKVLSDVGSFTGIRGGDVYPSLVQAADKKPIKVFLSDGTNDNRRPETPARDWYLQNKLMYEALRDKGYDVRYVLGENIHGSNLGGPIFPDSVRWLWSDQLVKAGAAK
jgi:enterochelin esterase family protein